WLYLLLVVTLMLVGLISLFLVCLFFFFQAEDGIRDFHVTGVQTCALPISWPWFLRFAQHDAAKPVKRNLSDLRGRARRPSSAPPGPNGSGKRQLICEA